MKILDMIRLPSPKELGRSERDTLPSGLMSSIKEGEYTWEAWHAEVKKDYPIRYFLSEFIPNLFFKYIKRPIKSIIYWVRSHIQPSKRYHMLDIRDKISGYSYGWIDADTQMLNACFNILKNFIEKECPSLVSWVEDHKDLDSETSETDIESKREVVNLYKWWVWDRASDYSEIEDLVEKDPSEENDKKIRALMAKIEQDETDMLPRLIAVREFLWT